MAMHLISMVMIMCSLGRLKSLRSYCFSVQRQVLLKLKQELSGQVTQPAVASTAANSPPAAAASPAGPHAEQILVVATITNRQETTPAAAVEAAHMAAAVEAANTSIVPEAGEAVSEGITPLTSGSLHSTDGTEMEGCVTNGNTGSSRGSRGGSALRPKEVLPDAHPYATAAIWQIPPRPLFFQAERSVAKKLAKAIMAIDSTGRVTA